MNKLFVVTALPCLIGLSACQQRERETERDVPADRTAPSSTDAPSRTPALGEGEPEAPVAAAAMTPQEIVVAFKTDIAKDPQLAPMAGEVILIVSPEGALVLQGTVPSEQHKQSFGDRANKTAGGKTVDNQIKVDPNAAMKGGEMKDDAAKPYDAAEPY